MILSMVLVLSSTLLLLLSLRVTLLSQSNRIHLLKANQLQVLNHKHNLPQRLYSHSNNSLHLRLLNQLNNSLCQRQFPNKTNQLLVLNHKRNLLRRLFNRPNHSLSNNSPLQLLLLHNHSLSSNNQLLLALQHLHNSSQRLLLHNHSLNSNSLPQLPQRLLLPQETKKRLLLRPLILPNHNLNNSSQLLLRSLHSLSLNSNSLPHRLLQLHHLYLAHQIK